MHENMMQFAARMKMSKLHKNKHNNLMQKAQNNKLTRSYENDRAAPNRTAYVVVRRTTSYVQRTRTH